MLEMNNACLFCHAKLDSLSKAHTCSYEYTWYKSCATQAELVCQSCQSDLKKRFLWK